MDETKQPGIIFRGIHVAHIAFQVFPENSEEKKLNLNIESEARINEEKTRAIIHLSVDPMKDVEKPPFKLQLEMIGIFEVKKDLENMELERFSTQNAPALMMPFVRQIIASLTSYGPMKPLLLPPINVMALVQASKSKGQQVSK